jgi:hypothetical protein
LQGEQQPEVPLQHLLQHAPILRGQGVPLKSREQCLAALAAQVDLIGSFHRGLHPLSNTTSISSETPSTTDKLNSAILTTTNEQVIG